MPRTVLPVPGSMLFHLDFGSGDLHNAHTRPCLLNSSSHWSFIKPYFILMKFFLRLSGFSRVHLLASARTFSRFFSFHALFNSRFLSGFFCLLSADVFLEHALHIGAIPYFPVGCL